MLREYATTHPVLGAEGLQVRCAARGRRRLQWTTREAMVVAGPESLLVQDDPTAPVGPGELLVLDAQAPDGALNRTALGRLRRAQGPVLVLRGRSVLDGAMLVVDDGTAASLPPLCAALAICSTHRRPVVLVGWEGDPGREGQRAAALQLFRRHATEPANELIPGPQALERLIAARGVTLAVVGAGQPGFADSAGGNPAETASCSVLVVR